MVGHYSSSCCQLKEVVIFDRRRCNICANMSGCKLTNWLKSSSISCCNKWFCQLLAIKIKISRVLEWLRQLLLAIKLKISWVLEWLRQRFAIKIKISRFLDWLCQLLLDIKIKISSRACINPGFPFARNKFILLQSWLIDYYWTPFTNGEKVFG